MSCTEQEWMELKGKEREGKELARYINELEDRIEKLEKVVFPEQLHYSSQIARLNEVKE